MTPPRQEEERFTCRRTIPSARVSSAGPHTPGMGDTAPLQTPAMSAGRRPGQRQRAAPVELEAAPPTALGGLNCVWSLLLHQIAVFVAACSVTGSTSVFFTSGQVHVDGYGELMLKASHIAGLCGCDQSSSYYSRLGHAIGLRNRRTRPPQCILCARSCIGSY